MKILVIGANGMLGNDLMKTGRSISRHEVVPATHSDLEITDPESTRGFIDHVRPRLVILSAAYTRVADCETNQRHAMAVNGEGTKNVALACREAKARLFYISTDYVFDGKKKKPFTEDDPTSPISVYGESKLKGEQAIQELLEDYLIIRTSWLYGVHGDNFVDTMLRKAEAKSELKVVNDQVGSPTYTMDLAEALIALAGRDVKGILNVTNTGHCSWYEFALKIFEMRGVRGATVRPVSSEEFDAPAARPANSVLSPERYRKVTGGALRHWHEGLAAFLEERRKLHVVH